MVADALVGSFPFHRERGLQIVIRVFRDLGLRFWNSEEFEALSHSRLANIVRVRDFYTVWSNQEWSNRGHYLDKKIKNYPNLFFIMVN